MPASVALILLAIRGSYYAFESAASYAATGFVNVNCTAVSGAGGTSIKFSAVVSVYYAVFSVDIDGGTPIICFLRIESAILKIERNVVRINIKQNTHRSVSEDCRKNRSRP